MTASSDTTGTETRYPWFSVGDINGFFGLMIDNVTVLAFLAFILKNIFGFPGEIIYTKMFPGTAFGVLFGDIVYTIMARNLARRTNNPNVTAMPLGLDTPSAIGTAFIVLGPCFVGLKKTGMSEMDAAMMTWYVGMATLVLTGIFKLAFSFVGGWVQKIVPQAGLLGSLAGIGLALIGFMPLLKIFGMPVVGMISLGLILYNLVAKIRLPRNFPGVFLAIGLGTLVYYVLGYLQLPGGSASLPSPEFHFGLPIPTLDFLKGLNNAMAYLPVAFPFALLTVIGGINVTESARVAGDHYNTRDILLTEAIATLIAGVCGGVAQSTPYIGQPAYKAMGSRAGYTLLTGIFVGLGGILGYIGFIVELIPEAVLAPILMFVALDIMCQAYEACPTRHAPAVAFAYFPTVARLLAIQYAGAAAAPDKVAKLFETAKGLPDVVVTVALGNGFILTAMLWGGFLAALIDRKLKESSVYLLICAGLTFFGIIHSAVPDGNMYLPWLLQPEAYRQIPYQFAMAYLVLAGMMFGLSFTAESREPLPQAGHGSGPGHAHG